MKLALEDASKRRRQADDDVGTLHEQQKALIKSLYEKHGLQENFGGVGGAYIDESAKYFVVFNS